MLGRRTTGAPTIQLFSRISRAIVKTRWQTDAMVGATQNAVVNDYDGGRDTSSTASGYDPYGLKTQLLTGASGPSVHQL
ncbi:hypothetical protein D7V95_03505 [bacterium J10(2018)]|nr:hypothetical protein D7V95_03505 [bacterium J10(2018)]